MDHTRLQESVNKLFTEAFVHTPLTERLRDIEGECRELCNFSNLKNLREEAGDLLASLIQLCKDVDDTIKQVMGVPKEVLNPEPPKQYENPALNTGYGPVDKIQLNNIRKVYHDKDGKENVIFDDFTLRIRDVKDIGQFVVLVGASGCGKSTILRYISGLQKPTSGEIIIDGKPQTSSDRVGMVFQ